MKKEKQRDRWKDRDALRQSDRETQRQIQQKKRKEIGKQRTRQKYKESGQAYGQSLFFNGEDFEGERKVKTRAMRRFKGDYAVRRQRRLHNDFHSTDSRTKIQKRKR